MPIVIKEMRVRTTVEKKIVSDAELSEEAIRRIEERILARLSSAANDNASGRKRKNDR